MERKRILTHTLKLWRERGDDRQAAVVLGYLSDANRGMGLCKEGIQQSKEASEIFERLGDVINRVRSFVLAHLLHMDKQFDAAEEAASRAIDLLPEEGEQFLVCNSHRALGEIYRSKGKTEKAIHHLEVALEIASSFNWHNDRSRIHCFLVEVFSGEGRFSDAHAHVEQAKSYAVNNPYLLARASLLQARVWDQQHMFEEAKSEALCVLGVFEKLGAMKDAGVTRELLRRIDRNAMDSDPTIPDESNNNGESLETMLLVMFVNFFVFGLDHRIGVMPSTLASSSSGVTISRATNASSIHPPPSSSRKSLPSPYLSFSLCKNGLSSIHLLHLHVSYTCQLSIPSSEK